MLLTLFYKIKTEFCYFNISGVVFLAFVVVVVVIIVVVNVVVVIVIVVNSAAPNKNNNIGINSQITYRFITINS